MKLSIIVPVYNVERFLRQCLDSVFAQTIDDYEVICVNDGSPDSSPAILREYAETHENLVIVDQENHGNGYARNYGISIAKGDYIGFVDADDFVEPNMFGDMVKVLQETDADIAITNPYIFDQKTRQTWVYRNMLGFYRMSLLGAFSPLEHPEVFSCLGCWDKVYRRSLLIENNIQFPVRRIFEDHVFSYKSLAAAKTVVVVKESYYYYRKNAGQSITDKEKQNDSFKYDFLQNAREMKAYLKEKGCYDAISATFLAYLLRDGMFHHSNATTNRSFRRIFDEMRALFDESDETVIRALNVEKFTWYYDTLKRCDYRTCKRKLNKMQSRPEQPQTEDESKPQKAKKGETNQ